jgi:hypothetical protein
VQSSAPHQQSGAQSRDWGNCDVILYKLIAGVMLPQSGADGRGTAKLRRSSRQEQMNSAVMRVTSETRFCQGGGGRRAREAPRSRRDSAGICLMERFLTLSLTTNTLTRARDLRVSASAGRPAINLGVPCSAQSKKQKERARKRRRNCVAISPFSLAFVLTLCYVVCLWYWAWHGLVQHRLHCNPCVVHSCYCC